MVAPPVRPGPESEGMPKQSSKRHRRWMGPLISIGALLAIDQVGGRIVMAQGPFKDRVMPPFCETVSDTQEEWLTTISGPREQRRNTVFHVDPDLGWTNAPSGVSLNQLETSNSLGYRGPREYAVPKPDGVTRLVCFGDSFTWGADVDDDGTYPAALERVGANVEAPNLGVSAYGTDQALMRFRRDGRDLEADWVVVGMMVENIGRNVNRYRPLWVPHSTLSCVKPRFVLEGDALRLIETPFADVDELVAAVRDGSVVEKAGEHEYWHTRPALRPLALSPTARMVGSVIARRQREVPPLWLDAEGEPYRVTRAILRAFDAEAKALGAQGALVVFLPTREAMHAVQKGDVRYWQSMLGELQADGIATLDAADALLAEQKRLRQAGEKRPIYTKQNHLRPHYNEVVARAILERLGLPTGSTTGGD